MSSLRITKLLLTFSFVLTFNAQAKATRTYLLKISGNQEMAQKLMTDLSKKECFALSSVDKMAKNLSDCHAFQKFQSEETGQSFLYQITINYPQKFNLQIYKKDGKERRRIVNGGDFIPRGNFYDELLKTAIRLTFK